MDAVAVRDFWEDAWDRVGPRQGPLPATHPPTPWKAGDRSSRGQGLFGRHWCFPVVTFRLAFLVLLPFVGGLLFPADAGFAFESVWGAGSGVG